MDSHLEPLFAIALAVAFFLLGWTLVPKVARFLLRRRETAPSNDTGALSTSVSASTASRIAGRGVKGGAPPKIERLLLGSALACMAFCCALLLPPLPSMLAILGLATAETACICDIREKIIPWECCLAMLILGIGFRLSLGPPSELIAAFALAVLLAALLSACNFISARLHSTQAIGAGDLRLIPALCCFGGVQGSLMGMFACASVMGVVATLALALKWATPRTGIPLAPGLALWLVAGVFACMLP